MRSCKLIICILTLFCWQYAAQASTLIKNATILTLAEGDDKPFVGYMVFDKGHIIALGKGEYQGKASDSVIDASNKILMPGFLSGHSHLWQSAFRGIAADKELYPWLQALHWTYGEYFDTGDFYNFTLHGALDQLTHGITTTYNHSQRLSATEPHYLESLEASLVAGQHFIFGYNANLALSEKELRSTFANLVKKTAELKKKTPMLALSVNAVGYHQYQDKFPLEMQIAKQYGLIAQIHYLEQYERRFTDRKQWPMFMKDGAVDSNISYAHFIHPTDRILKEAAEHGASMIWNPLSNGRLASGLSDIPKYLEAGLGVGMGVDGAASADIADPFENMRMGMYALRMQHKNASVMVPIEVLRLHTLKTAKVLKVDKLVGSLEPGKYADFLIVDPARPGTGAVFDAAATLVFACSAANIEDVYVAGEKLVENGTALKYNMADIQAELVKRVDQIRGQAKADGKAEAL